MKTFLLSTLFMLVTCSFVSGQGNFNLEYTSPAGEDFVRVYNTEKNNQIPEIITAPGSWPYSVYKIYDGATHNLKRTITIPGDSTQILFGWNDTYQIPADVNNDGIYEIFSMKSGQYVPSTLKVLDGANGNVLFTYTSVGGGSSISLPNFGDIDGDGYLELLFVVDDSQNSHLLKVYSTMASVSINNNSIQVPNYELKQNYPNPFNPSTTIEYSINKTADVQIKIYDISGREIQSLAKGVQGIGTYKVNLTSENLSSGTYFYQIIVNGISEAKKMVVIK
jgi:Secretion system C-terminal sorting domain